MVYKSSSQKPAKEGVSNPLNPLGYGPGMASYILCYAWACVKNKAIRPVKVNHSRIKLQICIGILDYNLSKVLKLVIKSELCTS